MRAYVGAGMVVGRVARHVIASICSMSGGPYSLTMPRQEQTLQRTAGDVDGHPEGIREARPQGPAIEATTG
eukprot:9470174-Pyramimonas_sp.AAC.3